ncbi:hypothetical protein ApAK_07095 [Thermoplasmatales archaeon AK]|nr:hypothetical protein [Thermoplasmatales archaeon AK]
MTFCWNCEKEIEGYLYIIGGHDYDLACANGQIERSKEILYKIMNEVDSFTGFGLGFDNPEFFWFVFVDDVSVLPFLKDEFAAAELGFNIFPSTANAIRYSQPPETVSIPKEPVQGGISVGNLPWITTGTLGGVLRSGEEQYIVSISRVLGPPGSRINDEIVQPSLVDFDMNARIVAKLSSVARPVPLNKNLIDAAIAKLQPTVKGSSRIKNIGKPTRIDSPQIGMDVRKSGRTTDYTEGKIIATDVSFKIFDYGKIYSITDHFLISSEDTEFATSGDEGSFILDNNNSLVGMITATFHAMAICSKASNLFERFGFDDAEAFEDLEED